MVFYDVKEPEMEVSVLHTPAPSGWTHEKRPLIECLTDPRAPKFRYILLEDDIYTEGKKLPQELTDYFQVPGHMLSNMYRRSNGFFHCDESFDKDGNLQSHNTWLRILIKVAQQKVAIEYIWYEMTICTRWSPDGCTVLCIAAPASFRRFLQDALLYMWPKLPTSEPYSLHVPALEAIVQMQDTAVWSIRDIIRKIEKERMQEDWVPDFKMLHEAGRHAIHSVETLAITVETLESIQKQCHKLANRMRDKTGKSLDNTFQIQTHIDSQVRVSRNFHLRSQSNRERLQNEISLGYNIVAQNDSKMMTRLGEASRLDSNAMRTIAVVTMAFLPPTFVSAIFSMSFFEFSPAEGNQPAQWAMSDQFWVYWVFALPLTGLTVAIWYWRNNPTKEKKLIEKLRNHHHSYWHHSK